MSQQAQANTVVVLDFETTGLSPDQGERAIEIGAVLIENGKITDSFQALMNPGRAISSFIEDYTGITNAMLQDAPPCEQVMRSFTDFIAGHNLVAHNASFDQRFLDAELARFSGAYSGEFGCSLLASRRVFQEAPNHKLGSLVTYTQLDTRSAFTDDNYHRALYDSEMTAKLWLAILDDIGERYGLFDLPFAFIQKLSKVPKKSVKAYLEKCRASIT